jgi:hypothetical protein
VTDGTILWLGVLAAMAVSAVVVLRRIARLINRTRELERFQQAADALDRRFAAAADPLVAALDDIRRHAGNPQALAEQLPPAAEALRGAATEARALRPPAPLVEASTALVRELDRAVRASELVEHGLAALLAVRGNRELEAQVSLKRGALNLRHSRGAFSQLVADIAAVRPADLAPGARIRPSVPLPAVPTYLVDGTDADAGNALDPRM